MTTYRLHPWGPKDTTNKAEWGYYVIASTERRGRWRTVRKFKSRLKAAAYLSQLRAIA